MMIDGAEVTPGVETERGLLTGRWYGLVPIVPMFYPAIIALSQRGENRFRWRYRGTAPAPELLDQSINAGVLAQFAIVPQDTPSILSGLVMAYNASPQDEYCYLAAVTDPTEGAGAVEGTLLFVRHLLRHWPFRKLYLESAEYNVHQYGSAVKSKILIEEGRLRDHIYFDGRYWDQVIFALYREAFREYEDTHPLLFGS